MSGGNDVRPPLAVAFAAPGPLGEGQALALLCAPDGSVLGGEGAARAAGAELPGYLAARFEAIVGKDRVHAAGGGAHPLLVLRGPEPGSGDPRGAELAGARLIRGMPPGIAAHLVVDASGLAPAESARLAFGARLAAYRFLRYRAPREGEATPCTALTLWSRDPAAAASAWAALESVAEGVELARDLVNEPPNVLTPPAFVDRLRALESAGLAVTVHDGAALEAMGAEALLAVGRGSPHGSYLVELRWQGGAAGARPLALVGKGMTFDTGGISIKNADGMHEVKWDMGGAATMAGTMLAIARQRLPVNAVAVLPIAENMPDGCAYRPGDVIRSLAGLTIEVTNTDAEGRLILADALAHCIAAHDPALVIDAATLTGAIINALGDGYAGLFATDAALAEGLRAAGDAEGERLWQMPVAEDYLEVMRSPVADLRNAAERKGDALNAAIFLRQFVDGRPWAHIDMAATVWQRRPRDVTQAESGTGFGVRLLTRFVAEMARG
ncbi:leucyl aminopeptidase [Sphingomonas canadensis]|uniref:Probable cytosol aminopeptidase n=1 Tax=Sphingomonas canadensis TaxID=1219257 RepID=A0ABW3HD31_9SPHN|nr:leucyl aminopeptidase [Sphingomonas canadensis]MCW3836938.1 leucyl aminopeptidase [Sphingomonas canadensis]